MKKVIKLLVILLIVYAGISYLIAYNIVSPVARHIDVGPDFVSSNFQNVSFKTSDNLTLKGWLFVPDAKKFIIFVPGFLDNRTNGGYYGVLLSKELIAQSYGVLLYDPRARGDSEGTHRLVNENLDILAAVNFIESRGVKPESIGIIAYSTGALSTLETIDRLDNLGGVVLDSTPTDFRSVITHVITVEQHIPGIFLPGTFFILNKLYGLNIDSKLPLEHLSLAKNIQLLILHDQHDLSVPVSDSRIIFSHANPNSLLVIFSKGSHIETYKFNVDEYREVLFKYLGEKIK